MKIFLFILSLNISLICFTQTENPGLANWSEYFTGETSNVGGLIINTKIIGSNEDYVFSSRTKGYKTYIDIYDRYNLNLVKSILCELKESTKKKYRVLKVFMKNENIALLYGLKDKKTNYVEYYIQEYNNDFSSTQYQIKSEDGKHIDSKFFTNDRMFMQSDINNRNKLKLGHDIKVKGQYYNLEEGVSYLFNSSKPDNVKNSNSISIYKVNEQGATTKINYIVPFSFDKFKLLKVAHDKDENLIILGYKNYLRSKEYYDTQEEIPSNQMFIIKFDARTKRIRKKIINIGSKFKSATLFTEPNGDIFLTGITAGSEGANGTFFIRYNHALSELKRNLTPFDKSFITDKFSENQLKVKDPSKKNEEPSLLKRLQYEIENIYKNKDGSYSLIVESKYSYTRTTYGYDSKGQRTSSTITCFINTGILYFKLSESGELITKINIPHNIKICGYYDQGMKSYKYNDKINFIVKTKRKFYNIGLDSKDCKDGEVLFELDDYCDSRLIDAKIQNDNAMFILSYNHKLTSKSKIGILEFIDI